LISLGLGWPHAGKNSILKAGFSHKTKTGFLFLALLFPRLFSNLI